MTKIIKIIERFNEEKVDFCVLRNYKNIEHTKDVDFLISKKDKKKVKKICSSFALKKGIDFGYYLSYKDESTWLDIRIGGLPYNGFCYKKEREILKDKKKFRNIFKLSDEEELINLTLHCVIDKGFFKEEYKKRIEKLLKNINEKKMFYKLKAKFGGAGEELFDLLKKQDYPFLLQNKNKLLLKLFNLRDIPNYLVLKLIKIRGTLRWIFSA